MTQRDAPPQVGHLHALREIQLRTRGAQLIVEVMDRRVLLLADIAGLQLACLPGSRLPLRLVIDSRQVARLEPLGREDVRRMDHRPPQCPNPRFGQHPLVLFHARGFPLACGDLRLSPPLGAVGAVDKGDGFEEAPAVFYGHAGKDPAVGGNRCEQFGRGAQAFEERLAAGVRRAISRRKDGSRDCSHK